jgi:hypothetical protein
MVEAVAARPHEVAARHFTSDASEVEARMAIDPHAGIPGIHGRPLPPPIDFGKAPSMATEARAAVEATARPAPLAQTATALAEPPLPVDDLPDGMLDVTRSSQTANTHSQII